MIGTRIEPTNIIHANILDKSNLNCSDSSKIIISLSLEVSYSRAFLSRSDCISSTATSAVPYNVSDANFFIFLSTVLIE